MAACKRKIVVSKRQLYRRVAAANFELFPCPQLPVSSPCSRTLSDPCSSVSNNNEIKAFDVFAANTSNLNEIDGNDTQHFSEGMTLSNEIDSDEGV